MRLFKKLTILYLLILAACTNKSPGGQYHFDLDDPSRPVFYWVPEEQELVGIRKSEWNDIVALFVVQDGKVAQTPVGLQASFSHDTCLMTPVMPLGHDMTFEWQFYHGGDTVKKRFKTISSLSSAKAGSCTVVSMYPMTDTLPSNVLLFHLFFSQPMREDAQAFNYVHIIDEAGKEKPFTWRQKASWADSGRQLVLMIHPGRIKRGINYATATGPLFEHGKRYTLKTEGALVSIDGVQAEPYETTFYIKHADRRSPSFMLFDNQQKPKAGTREPLHISFNEPMDYGTVGIGVEVKDKSGKNVRGHFEAVSDSHWLFIPDAVWSASSYDLVYNDFLADLASNHIERLFEMGSAESMEKGAHVAFSFTPLK